MADIEKIIIDPTKNKELEEITKLILSKNKEQIKDLQNNNDILNIKKGETKNVALKY